MCANDETKYVLGQCFLSGYDGYEAKEYFLETEKSRGVLTEVGGLASTCLRGAAIPAWFPRPPAEPILCTVLEHSSEVTLQDALESKAGRSCSQRQALWQLHVPFGHTSKKWGFRDHCSQIRI